MENKDNKGIIVKKSENFSDWYAEVVRKAELADYAPVRGFMVVRPRAYSIWQNIQYYFDDVLRKLSVSNAYFPLLIPYSFFRKEAKHAEGFAPELAYVKSSDAGEKLAIRPTSETIMYDSYSRWIRSWKDLPLKINQWCNVLRWEVKQAKPFIRTREFLWQEGHNVFATEKEAVDDMNLIAGEYKKMIETLLAIPVIVGNKSEKEKFPGAVATMSVEALMPDGRALQCGTSHNLGQGFAKVFNIKFLGKDEKEYYAWQTSWGFSTRLIGAVVMVHGDDKGLVLPPSIAEKKVVVVPIIFEKTKERVLRKSREIERELETFGAFVDDREGYKPGYKFNEWELKGIPLRIEIGPKELEKKKAILVRRDNFEKSEVMISELRKIVKVKLDEIQENLFTKARQFLEERIDEAKSVSELKKKLKEGRIVKVFMENDKRVEDSLKEKTGGATSRIIEESESEGKCIGCGKNVKTIAYFAKGY